MIELHYWPTPNGWKISIALEEMELPYELHPVNIGRGEQFTPEFLTLSPNGRMPAIVDREPVGGGDPISIFESGAILLYLAEKSRKFLPTKPAERWDVVQWLMWQMGGLGPMLGQNGHFRVYAPEPVPYALDRYTREAERLYGVLDKQLEARDHICGEYSIADMACWPWIITYKSQGVDIDGKFPNVRRWYDALKERPGLRRGYEVGREFGKPGKPDPKAREVLFGQKQSNG